MRYPKDQKERTRQRVVEVASRVFREEGIAPAGIVAIMKQADLTSGGFYAHFDSKEALLGEAIDLALDEMRRDIAMVAAEARAKGLDPLTAIIDTYLAPMHCTQPGCVLAKIGPELARQEEGIRRAAWTGAEDVAALIAAELPPGRRSIAAPLYAMMIGTLQLAMLAATPAEQEAVFAKARAAAYLLAGIDAG